jgi:primosomal protein N' (replication factor Y)
MYVKVRLLLGFRELLWYTVPEHLQPYVLQYAFVQVPLQQKIVPAFIVEHTLHKPNVAFRLRSVHMVEPFPADSQYMSFVTVLAQYHAIEPVHCIQRIKQFLLSAASDIPLPLASSSMNASGAALITLNVQQEYVYSIVYPYIVQPRYAPIVLHGVTGSGKTEVYKKLILEAHTHGRTTILLLPEVTLSLGFEHRLRCSLPAQIPVYGFHSATPNADKKELWQQLIQGTPLLIIGVHLPIMLPISNLGLIIVDEEHEAGYQEKKHPKINSRDAALMRAHIAQVPILLGSATPSLQTLYNVKVKGWRFVQLTERFAGTFPRVTVVPLISTKKRKIFWLSDMLRDAIKERLQRKEQIILFLNRRGHSFFVQCSVCSFVFHCTNCSVSLTLHHDGVLQCHYCGHKKQVPPQCVTCQASENCFIKKGIGTQKLVQIIAQEFPQAQIARADLDTTSKRKIWQKTIEDFRQGTIDILIGTQTITKGYDFPRVTLVGIIWADLHLNLPHFNAPEITLQQLIQVAGRAGRHTQHSDVVVQTLADHEIFSYVHEINYLAFYAHEMRSRKQFGYPPYKRLCMLELKHNHEALLEKEAYQLVDQLHAARAQYAADMVIMGPALPAVHKIQKIHFRQIYIKTTRIDDVYTLIKIIDRQRYKSTISFTPSTL